MTTQLIPDEWAAPIGPTGLWWFRAWSPVLRTTVRYEADTPKEAERLRQEVIVNGEVIAVGRIMTLPESGQCPCLTCESDR
jgi:hypothetical protein